MPEAPKLRQLGTTDIHISPVALGCWPIAGMTSLEINDADSLATLEAPWTQVLISSTRPIATGLMEKANS